MCVQRVFGIVQIKACRILRQALQKNNQQRRLSPPAPAKRCTPGFNNVESLIPVNHLAAPGPAREGIADWNDVLPRGMGCGAWWPAMQAQAVPSKNQKYQLKGR